MSRRDIFARALLYILGYPVFELIFSLEQHENIQFSLLRFLIWTALMVVAGFLDLLYYKHLKKKEWEEGAPERERREKQVKEEQEYNREQMELARAAQEAIDRRQRAALEETMRKEEQD